MKFDCLKCIDCAKKYRNDLPGGYARMKMFVIFKAAIFGRDTVFF